MNRFLSSLLFAAALSAIFFLPKSYGQVEKRRDFARDPYSFLIRWEKNRPAPYIDGNCWTVGIGHRLGPLSQRIEHRYYSLEEIDRFFDEDMAIAQRAAHAGIKNFDTLPMESQIVVISVIWTVGPTGFMKFKQFRKALETRNYPAAAKALFYSRRWGQIKYERASEEWDMIMSVYWRLDE